MPWSPAPSPYDRLLREQRTVFLRGPLDDAAAGELVAQLVELDEAAPDAPVSLCVHSPGGPFEAFAAVHDTMRHLSPEVGTVCAGRAEGTAALLLAAGTPGRRVVLPGSSVVLREPAAEGLRGRAADLEARVRHLERTRRRVVELLAGYCGRTPERVAADLGRGRYLEAAEAVGYGLADRVAERGALRPEPGA
ncbi:ATP-dependent Clp protease proteolytic subunit [Streptomyces sp. NPDC001380]|uniref:ATP-dependent Clp protease proteolytic subunit n=1 Tax=Streptomyces sp. NPDC001380 TaxID=3364566 RepID=UPI0036A64D24